MTTECHTPQPATRTSQLAPQNPQLAIRNPQPDFQLLFEASPHPYLILRTDSAFTIVAVNDSYLEATGTHRSELLGRGMFEAFPVNPYEASDSGVEDLRISLERVLRDRRQDIMGMQKYGIPRRDERGGFVEKYWSPVNTPVFGKDGSVTFIIHHVEDITEFVLAREHARQANTERIKGLQACSNRMEAEVLRRAAEVKEANRKLKAAMEELERREAELARLNERLSELDQAKTVFFSNVSHEFRTPLTLILGLLEEVLEKFSGGIAQESLASLAMAHRNGLRLLKLVNTLLDFSRIEAGRIRASYEPTDFASFTSDLASHFRSACESAGLELIVDCPPLPEPVYVDREMWEKIVLNLLSNAFKFTFEGRIEVRVQAEDGYAKLAVIDTGTGIPESELPRIFERFHRVEGSRGRSYEGSGIGLALVSELVQLHKGSISVESKPGRGSSFIVRIPFGAEHLPRHRIASRDTEQPAAPTAIHANAFVEEALRWLPESEELSVAGLSGGANGGGRKGRVVVADDNADMRAYIRHLLEASGYEVVTAVDGEAALSSCLPDPPDLVLTDVMMPVMDGFALLERLRADARTATVPVVMLSARAGEEALIEGLTAGADDYLVKPFGARELAARVDGAIGLSRVRKEAARREREVIIEANAALSREVEERKQIEIQLKKYMVELERSNRELDEFAYIASHDLKEPLRGIHNYAVFLEEDYSRLLDEEGRRYLERMQRLTERMSALIDRILAYSRLGRSELSRERVDVDAVLDRVAEDLKTLLEDHGVELRRGRHSPAIEGDPVRIGEVFQNLIANAVKYNDKPQKWVEVGWNRDGSQPVFYVRDNGIGIPERHQESVFRMFKRLHEQSKFGGGTGAGLAIVKKIVERHGGRIWIESAPGEGTTFYFTLSGGS